MITTLNTRVFLGFWHVRNIAEGSFSGIVWHSQGEGRSSYSGLCTERNLTFNDVKTWDGAEGLPRWLRPDA